MDFLDRMDDNKQVQKLYTLQNLIDEFFIFENESMDDKIHFAHYLKNYIRILKAAAETKRFSDSERAVIGTLYAATLGRLLNLEEDSSSNLIISLESSCKQNAKVSRKIRHTESNVNYQQLLDNKIKEAEQIEKELNTLRDGYDKEIINGLNDFRDEIKLRLDHEMKYKQQELRNELALKDEKKFNLVLNIINAVTLPLFMVPYIGIFLLAAVHIGTTVATKNYQSEVDNTYAKLKLQPGVIKVFDKVNQIEQDIGLNSAIGKLLNFEKYVQNEFEPLIFKTFENIKNEKKHNGSRISLSKVIVNLKMSLYELKRLVSTTTKEFRAEIVLTRTLYKLAFKII